MSKASSWQVLIAAVGLLMVACGTTEGDGGGADARTDTSILDAVSQPDVADVSGPADLVQPLPDGAGPADIRTDTQSECNVDGDCPPDPSCPVAPTCRHTSPLGGDGECVCWKGCGTANGAECYDIGPLSHCVESARCVDGACEWDLANPCFGDEVCGDDIDNDDDGLTDCDDDPCGLLDECGGSCGWNLPPQITCGQLVSLWDLLAASGPVEPADCEQAGGFETEAPAALLRFEAPDDMRIRPRSFGNSDGVGLFEDGCGASACTYWDRGPARYDKHAVSAGDTWLLGFQMWKQSASSVLLVCESHEICDDGVSNDGDTDVDCDDWDCRNQLGPDGSPCSAGGTDDPEICDDGSDNDLDGDTDCDDDECTWKPECASACDESLIVDVDCDTGPVTVDLLPRIVAGTVPEGLCYPSSHFTEMILRFVPSADGRVAAYDRTRSGVRGLLAMGGRCDRDACDEVDQSGGGPVDVTAGTPVYFILGTTVAALTTATVEVVCEAPESCDDGVDNDFDGDTDCVDTDCAEDGACARESECGDWRDNDGDGETDCTDEDCAEALDCEAETVCFASRDEDGDGLTDCADPDCAGSPFCPAGGTCAAPYPIAMGESVYALPWDRQGVHAGGCAPDERYPEVVWTWTAEATGPYCLTSPNMDWSTPALYVRTSCGDPGSEVGCAVRGETSAPVAVDFDAEAGETYYLFAEGEWRTIRIVPGTCPDWAQEVCNDVDDDGNGLTDEVWCPEDRCDDERDNDGDGKTDCDDYDCWESPLCEVACVDNPPDSVIGDNPRTAVPIPPGFWRRVDLCPALDQDWLTFTLDEPSLVYIEVRQLDHRADIWDVVMLLDESLRLLGEGGMDIDQRLLPAGKYYIVASGLPQMYEWSNEDYVLDLLLSIGPQGAEVCDDGVDNDGDGRRDCRDEDCVGFAGNGAMSPGCHELCDDQVDNDADGETDCADEDCDGERRCKYGSEQRCSDGQDNDGDGHTNCADEDCHGRDWCEYGTELSCGDGQDNDGDREWDCRDPDCQGVAFCTGAPEDEYAPNERPANAAEGVFEATGLILYGATDWFVYDVCPGGTLVVDARPIVPRSYGMNISTFAVGFLDEEGEYVLGYSWRYLSLPQPNGGAVAWRNDSAQENKRIRVGINEQIRAGDIPLPLPYNLSVSIIGCER